MADDVEKTARDVAQTEAESQLAHLRARNAQLESQLKQYMEERGSLVELGRLVSNAVVACEPFPRVPYKRPPKSDTPIAAVQNVSDWHIGERIRKEETEGFGEFNWKIAQRRLFKIGDKVTEYMQAQRESYTIDELHLFCIGDYISGGIHYELDVTNEFPVPAQTANAGLLLGEFAARLAPHFARVVLVEVGADNHGRLTRKPQAKQKAQNNMSYLVHSIANAYLRNHANVETVVAEGPKLLYTCNKQRFLIEHGDAIRGWAGVPYYGMERSKAREAVKRMRTEQEFDYMSIGHFHVPAIISGNILVNGSLSGTSEFDHVQGRHAPPAQVFHLVHPRYGAFNWVAWRP